MYVNTGHIATSCMSGRTYWPLCDVSPAYTERAGPKNEQMTPLLGLGMTLAMVTAVIQAYRCEMLSLEAHPAFCHPDLTRNAPVKTPRSAGLGGQHRKLFLYF